MAEQIILEHRVLDANGDPLSGAKLYAYIEGTSTLEPIYTTSALSTAHPSPLVSDAGGNFPQIWHAGDHGVKIVITDASDVELSWSPLDPCPATSSATTASNISFTPTADNPASNVQEAIQNATSTGSAVSEHSSNFTVVANDVGTVIRCTATLTASLSTATQLGNGFVVTFIADGGAVTIDPNGIETIDGVATKTIYDGQTVRIHCDGTGFYTASISDPIMYSGPTAATSGTTVDFTGLPSGVNWVNIVFDRVSLSSAEDLLVQLSSASTFVTTGYLSTSCYVEQTTANTTDGVGNSNGFVVYVANATDTFIGRMRLTRSPGTNIWIQDHTGRKGDNAVFGGGYGNSGGALDAVRITRTNSGTFDSGNVFITWGY